MFISFIALYIYCKLEQILKNGELNRKMTPVDLLFKCGKVYHVDLENYDMVTEVPKIVRNLWENPGLNTFPN
ncbi:MAG: hypothetical protein DIAAKJNI_00467 [Candidatus Argoarchaeum ethanivorans]|uniref:Uncharacterized protein n=1 Tax=Candidatus Argoarchaeum ethanivorans TaxID=2608793 RepID=A0A811TC34_9EURY|nr:MAG: hypothetical protein DIAAKJNI_00467 [Candidatus Argoarchaeum ethanivorans]